MVIKLEAASRLVVAAVKHYTYKGGYKSPAYSKEDFYNLKLNKGDVLAIEKVGNNYVVTNGTKSTKVPLSHKGNITKFLKNYTSPGAAKPKSIKPIKTKLEPKGVKPKLQGLDKQLEIFWKLYDRYRSKFPPTSPAHIKVFEWAKEFSGVSSTGSKKLYRGSQLRGSSQKVGQKFKLKHARGLISFSGKASVAKQFALYKNKIGKRVVGDAYVLEAHIPAEAILVSPEILKAMAKKCSQLEKIGQSDLGMSEILADEAQDLKAHEDEYFVLIDSFDVVVKAKFSED